MYNRFALIIIARDDYQLTNKIETIYRTAGNTGEKLVW